MKKLVELLLTFMKIGAFTFGGGYAMISVIEDECVERRQWITHDEMMKMVVIAESTPGPIAINCATYIGYLRAGLTGALFATLGVVVPSFSVIYMISMFLDNFLEYEVVINAFKGIKVAIGLIIFNVGRNMMRKMTHKKMSFIIWGIAFSLMFVSNIISWKISSVSLIIFASIVGAGSLTIRNLLGKESEE